DLDVDVDAVVQLSAPVDRDRVAGRVEALGGVGARGRDGDRADDVVRAASVGRIDRVLDRVRRRAVEGVRLLTEVVAEGLGDHRGGQVVDVELEHVVRAVAVRGE